MNVGDLYGLLRQPSSMSTDTLLDLRKMVNQYPSFQVAKVLYLQNLALLNDENFVAELERLAISLPDRKRLFRLIEGERYHLDCLPKGEDRSREDDTFSLIDAFLSDKEEDLSGNQDDSILFQPSVSSDYMFWSLSSDGKMEEDKKQSNQLLHQDLIDSFIEKDQQRLPGRGLEIQEEAPFMEEPESVRKLNDEQSNPLEDSCLTETLARIYIKQKRYDKALQIIKNLSLKYPEKNVYFADQIRFLEKLIINH